jgi:uncharacterized membrane protein YqaE (UPF0057 family)
MDYLPKNGKLDLTPRRYHGYNVLLFILGTLFPPLGRSTSIPSTTVIHLTLSTTAVAARFGIGKDFWINLFLTICGYFPGACALICPNS